MSVLFARYGRQSVSTWMLLALICLCGSGCAVNGRAMNSQGVSLFQQGNLDGAQVAFQKALSNEPTNANIYYNMGRVHHQKARQFNSADEYKQAENWYHLCLDHDMNHRECYRSLALMLVEDNRSEQAFTLIERWSTRSPSIADPKVELARLYEDFNDRDHAKTALIEALAVEPNNSRALAALGRVREQTGETAQALVDYQRSLQFNQFQPDVVARVAALQSQLYSTTNTGTRTVSAPNTPVTVPQR